MGSGSSSALVSAHSPGPGEAQAPQPHGGHGPGGCGEPRPGSQLWEGGDVCRTPPERRALLPATASPPRGGARQRPKVCQSSQPQITDRETGPAGEPGSDSALSGCGSWGYCALAEAPGAARVAPCHCAAPLLEPPAQAQRIPGYVSAALLQARPLPQAWPGHGAAGWDGHRLLPPEELLSRCCPLGGAPGPLRRRPSRRVPPRTCSPRSRPHLRGLARGLGQLLGEVAQQALGHGVLADIGVDGEHGHGGGSGGGGASDESVTERQGPAQ